MNFLEWEALWASGATLEERLDWERGEKFPNWFKAKVIAWYDLHRIVQRHMEDAATPRKR